MVSLRIDDHDAALYSVGQVAEMLQVTQAFLRRLDDLAVVCPSRSAGGQRRYSRRHIATVARVPELAGEGLTLAARRVLALEDRISLLEASLAAAEAKSARLQTELAQRGRAADRDGRPALPPAPACGAQPGSSPWPAI